jgi:hypothetical protein
VVAQDWWPLDDGGFLVLDNWVKRYETCMLSASAYWTHLVSTHVYSSSCRFCVCQHGGQVLLTLRFVRWGHCCSPRLPELTPTISACLSIVVLVHQQPLVHDSRTFQAYWHATVWLSPPLDRLRGNIWKVASFSDSYRNPFRLQKVHPSAWRSAEVTESQPRLTPNGMDCNQDSSSELRKPKGT